MTCAPPAPDSPKPPRNQDQVASVLLDRAGSRIPTTGKHPAAQNVHEEGCALFDRNGLDIATVFPQQATSEDLHNDA